MAIHLTDLPEGHSGSSMWTICTGEVRAGTGTFKVKDEPTERYLAISLPMLQVSIDTSSKSAVKVFVALRDSWPDSPTPEVYKALCDSLRRLAMRQLRLMVTYDDLVKLVKEHQGYGQYEGKRQALEKAREALGIE